MAETRLMVVFSLSNWAFPEAKEHMAKPFHRKTKHAGKRLRVLSVFVNEEDAFLVKDVPIHVAQASSSIKGAHDARVLDLACASRSTTCDAAFIAMS